VSATPSLMSPIYDFFFYIQYVCTITVYGMYSVQTRFLPYGKKVTQDIVHKKWLPNEKLSQSTYEHNTSWKCFGHKKEPRAFYATVSLNWENYPSLAEFIDPVWE
jgi:hypothetical protein